MWIEFSEAQTTNKSLLEKDKKILELLYKYKLDKKPDKPITDFNKQKDFKLAETLENTLLILFLSDNKFVFYIQLLVKSIKYYITSILNSVYNYQLIN